MDIFNIIMHCLVFHVVSGAAAAYYAYRRSKVVGAAYSYGILSASVLWSVIGTLSFGLLLKFERHREWTQLIIYQFFLKQADCSFQAALDLKRTLTDTYGHLQTNQHNFP